MVAEVEAEVDAVAVNTVASEVWLDEEVTVEEDAGLDSQDEHPAVSVTTTVDSVVGPGKVTVTVPLAPPDAVSVSTTVSEIMTVDGVPGPGGLAVLVAVMVTVPWCLGDVGEELSSFEVIGDSSAVTEVTIVALSNVLDNEIVTVDIVSSELFVTDEINAMEVLVPSVTVVILGTVAVQGNFLPVDVFLSVSVMVSLADAEAVLALAVAETPLVEASVE